MSTFVRHASIVSTVALMALGTAGFAGAQTQDQGDRRGDCVGNMENCAPQEMRRQRDSDGDTSRRRFRDNDDTVRSSRDDNDNDKRVREARSDWRFDSNRHERRRDRDDRFRFHFGGYWYPEPYWLGYGLALNPRVSCAEGRSIVRDRGFNRTRTVECRGRSFTYLGRRHGDTFRVIVNSRNGRIIDIDLV